MLEFTAGSATVSRGLAAAVSTGQTDSELLGDLQRLDF